MTPDARARDGAGRRWCRLAWALTFVAGATLSTSGWTQSTVPVPTLTAPVTDLARTLTTDQASALDAKLRAFASSRGSQVVVLIVPTTAPEPIEAYSIRVVDQWRLGRQRIDDGVLLLVAIDDRRVRIEVGYGLEGALPDATANRIIQQDILPSFRRGDFYGGINTGVDRVMRVIEGEPLPEPELNPPAAGVPGLFQLLPVFFVFAIVGGSVMRRMFGRFGGAVATGGIVGAFTWLLVSLLGTALVAGVVAFLFVLLGGFGGPRGGGWYSPRHRGGWNVPPGGFGGGWGGGGGLSGGGFRGGGGGFGGGGASGGW